MLGAAGCHLQARVHHQGHCNGSSPGNTLQINGHSVAANDFSIPGGELLGNLQGFHLVWKLPRHGYLSRFRPVVKPFSRFYLFLLAGRGILNEEGAWSAVQEHPCGYCVIRLGRYSKAK